MRIPAQVFFQEFITERKRARFILRLDIAGDIKKVGHVVLL